MTHRNVTVGGSVTGSSIFTGDQNIVTTTYTKTTLPPAETVRIESEIEALRQLLADLKTGDRSKILNALAEAAEEAAKPEPKKDEIGKALERALDYTSKAEGFAEKADKLILHVTRACAWLGENWYKLLGFVGLVA